MARNQPVKSKKKVKVKPSKVITINPIDVLKRMLFHLEDRCNRGMIKAGDVALTARLIGAAINSFPPPKVEAKPERVILRPTLTVVEDEKPTGCVHGLGRGCAICSGLVSAIEPKEAPRQRMNDGVIVSPGFVKFILGDYPNSPFKGVEMPKPRDLNAPLSCTFCGKPVSRVVATIGTRPEYRRDEVVDFTSDPAVTRERIRVTATEQVACPNCALKVKPILDKDGEYVRHGLRFDLPADTISDRVDDNKFWRGDMMHLPLSKRIKIGHGG